LETKNTLISTPRLVVEKMFVVDEDEDAADVDVFSVAEDLDLGAEAEFMFECRQGTNEIA
jgi:hypothetical protein